MSKLIITVIEFCSVTFQTNTTHNLSKNATFNFKFERVIKMSILIMIQQDKKNHRNNNIDNA